MTDNYNVDERGYDWGEEFTYDTPTYVTLPEGEYPFTVKSWERAVFQGSAKLPACNMAEINISVDGGALGVSNVKRSLFMHPKTRGFIGEYFEALGMAKHGDTIKVDFDGSVGRRGRCAVKVREYVKKNGETGSVNEVVRFLPYEPETDSNESAFVPGDF